MKKNRKSPKAPSSNLQHSDNSTKPGANSGINTGTTYTKPSTKK